MKKQGYILFLTMMMLAAGTAIITQVFYVGNLYNSYISLTLDRERAQQLALSGASIAMSQLVLQDKKLIPEKEKKSEPEDSKKDPNKDREQQQKDFFKLILTVQNKWQNFTLTHEADGIDADLKICISCESGKIDINRMYEFKIGKFVGDFPNMKPEPMLKLIGERLAPLLQEKNITEPLFEFLKSQKRPLLTVTEFLKSKQLSVFKNHVFYVPSDVNNVKSDSLDVKPQVYLADLFTVNGTGKIDPWTMSSSLRAVLGLNPDVAMSTDVVSDIIKKISLSKINWETDWDKYLKPIYGKEYKALPKEILPFLSSKFEPRMFSVLCYAKVGRVTQKLLAVLEKVAVKDGERVRIIKIYWI